MGHLVCQAEEIKPHIEAFIDRNGREGFSQAMVRRIYGILSGEQKVVTHKVADKLYIEMDRLDLFHTLHFEEVTFR